MARSNHSGSVERVYHDEHREAMAQSQYSNYIQYQSQQNMGGGSSQQQNYGGNPNQNPYQSQSNLNNNIAKGVQFSSMPDKFRISMNEDHTIHIYVNKHVIKYQDWSSDLEITVPMLKPLECLQWM
eukprot:290952_1